MNIILINPYDIYGGAEKIACQLVSIYNKMGHNACLVVSHKFSEYKFVVEIPHPAKPSIIKFINKIYQSYSGKGFLKKLLRQLEEPGSIRKIFTGREKPGHIDFKNLLDEVGFSPEIVHFHNVRGIGPQLICSAARFFPVLITLHDLWLLTGKCVQPGECTGWKSGCNNCIQAWFPLFPVKNGIFKNLKEKIECLTAAKPYISTPSLWAMNMVNNSYIGKVARELKIIHNGVDLSIFKPGNKTEARRKLGLPEQVNILLVSGKELKTNRYKNFRMLKKIAVLLGNKSTGKRVIMLCLGDKGKKEFYRNLEIRFIPFEDDENLVAEYYRSADVFASAAENETWGLTVSEAMACGTPVVAFSNGGIKEQIIDGKTGFLIPVNCPEKMTESIKRLFDDAQLNKKISLEASLYARQNFDIKDTALKYLEFYQHILKKRRNNENSKGGN